MCLSRRCTVAAAVGGVLRPGIMFYDDISTCLQQMVPWTTSMTYFISPTTIVYHHSLLLRSVVMFMCVLIGFRNRRKKESIIALSPRFCCSGQWYVRFGPILSIPSAATFGDNKMCLSRFSRGIHSWPCSFVTHMTFTVFINIWQLKTSCHIAYFQRRHADTPASYQFNYG